MVTDTNNTFHRYVQVRFHTYVPVAVIRPPPPGAPRAGGPRGLLPAARIDRREAELLVVASAQDELARELLTIASAQTLRVPAPR